MEMCLYLYTLFISDIPMLLSDEQQSGNIGKKGE